MSTEEEKWIIKKKKINVLTARLMAQVVLVVCGVLMMFDADESITLEEIQELVDKSENVIEVKQAEDEVLNVERKIKFNNYDYYQKSTIY